MTEQEKREKVIEGLNDLRSHFQAMAGISSSRQGRANHIESARTIEDAIALLKTQEPRVLTLEELRNLPEDPPAALVMEERVPVYTWDGGSVCKWCGSLFVQEEYLSDNRYINADTYGKIWRVWTSWPSAEQREAVKWE